MPDHRVNSPRVLFLALTDNVGMDRLPGAMAKLGAVCALISPPGFYATNTCFIEHHFALPRHYGIWLGTAFVRSRLSAAVRTWHPDIVIPLDDVASNLLRNLALRLPSHDQLRDLIEVSLGSSRGYPAASSRAELMRVARSAGVRLPEFHVAEDPDAALRVAAEWGYPVVLKVENSCGGSGVSIVPNAKAMGSALSVQPGLATTWRRCRRAAREWMWKRAGVITSQGAKPIMQALIQGAPAMRTVAAWKGQVLAGVSFRAEQIHPAPTGASTIVRHIRNFEMEEAVRRLVEVLGCSGIVSFDFMLGDADDAAYLIEMNPRPIGTTHLGGLFGHDVVAVLLARLQGKPTPAAAASHQPDQLIAVFPKELERDPFAIERLRSSGILHDVPYDDPTLVSAYMRRLSHIHPGVADILSPQFLSGRNPSNISAMDRVAEPAGASVD